MEKRKPNFNPVTVSEWQFQAAVHMYEMASACLEPWEGSYNENFRVWVRGSYSPRFRALMDKLQRWPLRVIG